MALSLPLNDTHKKMVVVVPNRCVEVFHSKSFEEVLNYGIVKSKNTKVFYSSAMKETFFPKRKHFSQVVCAKFDDTKTCLYNGFALKTFGKW